MEKIRIDATRGMAKGSINFVVDLTRQNYDTIELDGDRVDVAEYMDLLTISIYRDGEHAGRSFSAPSILTGRPKDMPSGAYAQLTNSCYLSEPTYNEMMALIDDVYAETNAPEIVAAKQARDGKIASRAEAEKKSDAKYQRLIDSGMCPVCRSWCYGDCDPSAR